MKIFLLATMILLSNVLYSNSDTINVNSLEEAIKISSKKFRNNLKDQNAVVYYIVKVDLKTDDIELNTNDIIIQNDINEKFVNKKFNNYLLEFRILISDEKTIISVIPWSVIKKTRKKIIITDLIEREYYKIGDYLIKCVNF